MPQIKFEIKLNKVARINQTFPNLELILQLFLKVFQLLVKMGLLNVLHRCITMEVVQLVFVSIKHKGVIDCNLRGNIKSETSLSLGQLKNDVTQSGIAAFEIIAINKFL